MELFNILFSSLIKNKIINASKIYIYILLFLSLIATYNSISTEIKIASIPYIYTLKNSKIRNLTEQNIYGSAFKVNYYYSNIYIGENMQKQGLILDTGSSITTSTCSPLCKSCGKHIRPPYDIQSKQKIISCSDTKCRMVSSKCKRLNSSEECPFSISYSEGSSLNGVFINELIRFGKNYKEQKGAYIPIGCTISETHLFLKQEANGIMGLNNNDYNFVTLLYKLGAIKKNIFSLCFAQLGGIFTLGEINNKTHTENITFIPMFEEKGKYFKLNIKSILVNGKKLESYNQNQFQPFIDSGTTISYFENNIFNEILKLTKEECEKFDKKEACGKYEYNSIFGHCFYFDNTSDLNYAVKNYWPTIHFILEGYDYKWTPEKYVFNISDINKTGACMGFANNYGKRIKLGASWIIGHDIIFDRENKLLGFAEADCYQNKNLNLMNGLELDINNNNFGKNINYISRKYKLKKNISLIAIILACILIFLMVIFIFLIAFKVNTQENIKKEIELKIKENSTIKNKNNIINNKMNYINVSEDNLNTSKIQISTNQFN